MQIKPPSLIQRILAAQLPQVAVDRNIPRAPLPLKPPAGRWNFSKGKIVWNGEDVGKLIDRSRSLPSSELSRLAQDLNLFRNYTLRRYSKKRKKKVGGEVVIEEYDPSGELGKLSALVDAYIAKIMRLLKRKYDETADGLSCTLDENGQLIINGMNVHSFIEMAGNYPSKKALLFLKGLKNRLGVILGNRSANPSYDKLREVITSLIDAIDDELKRIVDKESPFGNS